MNTKHRSDLYTSVHMAGSFSSLVSPLLPTTTNPTSYNVDRLGRFVSVKLYHTNYLLWKFQFLAILYSHDLVGYIDGTLPCPFQFLVADKVPTLNQEYIL